MLCYIWQESCQLGLLRSLVLRLHLFVVHLIRKLHQMTLFENPSNVHAVPSQQLDPGNGCEFNSRTPMLIEVFCGTAGISAQFKLAGGRSVGIDHGCKI